MALISLLKDHLKEKRDLDKDYFDQYINPIWEQFNDIHNDYKSSFKNYIDLASSDDFDESILIRKISHDSIFSSDLRTRLKASIEYIPNKNGSKEKDHCLVLFINNIYNYFGAEGGEVYPPGIQLIDCAQHITMIKCKKFSNVFREDAIADIRYHRICDDRIDDILDGLPKLLSDILIKIQQNYDEVAQSYYCLRNAILK